MLDSTRQAERFGEVGDDRNDLDLRETSLQLGGALLQIIAGNVDRHVSRGTDRFEEYRRLGLRACAELNDDRAFGNARRDVRHDLVENRSLRPRGIVRWKP